MAGRNVPLWYRRSVRTLRYTSYDKENGEYLTDSFLPVINFDFLKEWYRDNVLGKRRELPASNDALYISDDRIVFIEFKNKKNISTWGRKGIYHKISNSIFLLLDSRLSIAWRRPDFKCSLDYMRENMEYIFVYNQTKRGTARQELLGNMNHRAKFELGGLEGFLFSKVRTYDMDEFRIFFVQPEEKTRMKHWHLKKCSGRYRRV